MTGDTYTIDELRNAELVPGQGGPNAYLVRFGENDYDFVNKTPKNQLLMETDLLDNAAGGLTFTDENGRKLTFTVDLQNDVYRLKNGRVVYVTPEYEDTVIQAVTDDDGETLFAVYDELADTMVRMGVMDQFLPRFESERDRIARKEKGWVIDETFIVRWNGENYLVNGQEVHERSGDGTVAVDESRQARVLDFDVSGDKTITAPHGSEIEVSEQELQFLATVECLLHPEEYLTDEQAEYVSNRVEEVKDPIGAMARTATVSGFTDEKTGLYHGHGINKHRLGDLGVTQETIDRLYYNDYDHAGVVELAFREDEFRNADFDVFTDAHNRDTQMWKMIQDTKKHAPVPDHVRRDLRSMYG